MRTAIIAFMVVVGVFASMTTHVTPAQALTCEQTCNNAYQACLLMPGQTKALCLSDRAECLFECP